MKQGLQTIWAAVGLVGIGVVLGYLLGAGTHQLAQAECCAQFDVPFNTQLEQEMEGPVSGRVSGAEVVCATWTPPRSYADDPCRR